MQREGGLLAWQWRTYERYHRDRLSLLMHFAGMPMFVAGVLAALRMATLGQWFGAVAGMVFAAFGFALQAVGHKREAEPPVPFDGPGDFFARLFAEQFITFPRFVLSGGWARNFQQSGDNH
jgi:uncharacterized membrane protein YGL010W